MIYIVVICNSKTKMAQRLILNKAPYEIAMVINDDELAVFEFQDFWEKVKEETNVSIDTYSGRGINLDVNRKLALLMTNQLYKIEEGFPESKKSVYDLKKQISKPVVIRFFEDFIKLLDKANNEKLVIGIEGE